MEKSISKKLFAGVLALSASFILASCDPVSASLKDYNHPIVVNNDNTELGLDENNLGTLYDSITSERNAKIVSDILEEIAEKKFGTYADLLNATDNDKKIAFVDAHEDFFKSIELNATNEEKLARFEFFKSDIEERISEYFYNEIKNTDYEDDLGRFSEEKLYKKHKYELYDLVPITNDVKENVFFVDSSVTKENAASLLKGQYYNTAEGARGYIEQKVYPDILKNKLVEDYIYVNNPSSLGRAYGRKVSYVKIAYEDSLKDSWELMRAFADTYIKNATAVTSKDDEAINFELLNYAIKGFTQFDFIEGGKHYLVNNNASDTAVNNLLLAAYADNKAPYDAYETETVPVADPTDPNDPYVYEGIILVKDGNYCKYTKLGKLIESYNKAIQAEGERFPDPEYEEELAKFTEKGKSKQYGLMKKIIELAQEDYTTDGWYVKNGGITELPSALRDRLFNIKVANVLDDPAKLPVETDPVTYDSKNYVRNIKGRKVVVPTNAIPYSESEPFNYIYRDDSGKAFYICQVLEAPSTAKLNDLAEEYTKLDKESIKRQIAKLLGTKDSYIKDAYTELLNNYEFTFFDTSLYDYFKSEYPDLDQFDED